MVFGRTDRRYDTFTYTGKDGIFSGTTDQLLDAGTYCYTSFRYQLDTVFGYCSNRRSINHFRVYRHLYSFEYVTSCQVDSSSHLERQFDVVLGVAFIQNIYGNAGMAPLMILGSVPLFNIFAVLILTMESPLQRSTPSARQLLRGVATNPILLGIIFGTVYALLPFTLPQMVTKTMSSLASLTTPLSLLSIGASFEGTKAIQKLGPTVAAAFIKTVGLAAVFLPCAVALGFRDEELVALLIMLGSPTTPSAYVMSKNMGHEGVLTSSCIALTTLLSALTLTGWIFLLRCGGYL